MDTQLQQQPMLTSSPSIKISSTSTTSGGESSSPHALHHSQSASSRPKLASLGLRTNPSQTSLKAASPSSTADHSPSTPVSGGSSSGGQANNATHRSASTSSSSAFSNSFFVLTGGSSQPTTPTTPLSGGGLASKSTIIEEKSVPSGQAPSGSSASSVAELKLDVDLLSKKIDSLIESDV